MPWIRNWLYFYIRTADNGPFLFLLLEDLLDELLVREWQELLVNLIILILSLI